MRAIKYPGRKKMNKKKKVRFRDSSLVVFFLEAEAGPHTAPFVPNARDGLRACLALAPFSVPQQSVDA